MFKKVNLSTNDLFQFQTVISGPQHFQPLKSFSCFRQKAPSVLNLSIVLLIIQFLLQLQFKAY